MKKLLYLAIVLLVLQIAVPVSAGRSASLVVDDDGIECRNATHATIQAAVDDASPGDKIQVCAGTYFGATVNKAVRLQAKGMVVVNDGPHTHPFLRAGFYFPDDGSGSGARISGFYFVGTPQSDPIDDGKLDFPIYSGGADNVTITNNTMVNSLQGITNWNGSGWKITNNKIVDLWTLSFSSAYGILVGGRNGQGPFKDNRVANNEVTGTLHVAAGAGGTDGAGIILVALFGGDGSGGAVEMTKNRIVENEISLTSDNPSAMDVVGIMLADTRVDPTPPVVFGNKVSGNEIEHVGRYGIAVSGAPGNRLVDNEIKDSGAFDAFDDTTGSGTAGTANHWKDNDCDTSSPDGLCGED
jgi:hypothetical protein